VIVETDDFKEIANQLQKFYFEQYLPGNFRAQNLAKSFSEKNSWELVTKRYEEKFQEICNK
jgi:glycosyltransferase involved in cell wall biosynthesis